jgi:hypothetical protein
LTDLCEYCEQGRIIKVKIDSSVKEFGYNIGEYLNLDAFKEYNFKAAIEYKNKLNEKPELENSRYIKETYEKHKLSVELINVYEQIVFHQNVNKVQRACYKNHHNSITILNNKFLIEMDYKQRIRIGMSPRQVGQEYYNQETRSCLG